MVGVPLPHCLFITCSLQVHRPNYFTNVVAITHIFDATTHPSLAQTATRNLQLCLAALKQMGVAWPSASRSYMMIGDAPRLGMSLFVM